MNGGQPSSGSQDQYTVRLGNMNVPINPRNLNVVNMARGMLPTLPGHFMRPPNFQQAPAQREQENPVVVNMDQMSDHDFYSSTRAGHHVNLPRFDLNQQLASFQQVNPIGSRPSPPNPPSEDQTAPSGVEGQLDWRLFVGWLQNSGIFLILLFLRLMYDHRLGLLIFLALGGTFHYVNQRLVSSIHQFSVREFGNRGNILKLIGLVIYLTMNISFVYYMFSGQVLWKSLIFQTPNVGEFDIWTLLWVVLITDYMIKFSTVILKCCITMLPNQVLKQRRRGKYYMFLEYLSQCFRQLMPIIPWMHFLSDDQLTGKWFASFEVILYLLFKVNIVWVSIRELQKAFQRFRVQTIFGDKPSSEDLKQRGESCPICQDELKDPVMLTCKHIFCEDCVSVWFDRERTCPMCRAQITDNPKFQDGTTAMHLQWY